ncbi:MAG: tetratricopeptide repeat protein [Myxococcales bacterium]|nr:tetratricopeptide repeat protein [Myxococcales bacterium]
MALNREKVHQTVQRLVLKGQIEKAIAELRPILEEDPNDTRTLQKVAELYRKKGSYQEAEAVYTRLADVLLRGGFYQRAVAVHHQILQLNPTNLPVHIVLGDTLTKLGLVQEANKIFARTVGLLQRAGRFEEATAILEKLIAASPDNYQARLQLAELYLKAGRNDAAVKAFEDALPTLRAQGRDDLFQRAAERLLYYQPDNLALCRELSLFHLRRQNVPQAMKLLQYCHKKDPNDVDTLRLLASHFGSTGDVQKAVVVLHQMARVFSDRGDRAAAADVWRKILEMDPDNLEAREALGSPPASAPRRAPGSPPRRLPPPPGRAAGRPAAPGPIELAEPVEDGESVEAMAPEDLEEVHSAEVQMPPEETAAGTPQTGEATPVPAELPRPPARAEGRDLPPLPEEASDVQKIAAEADIFVKFGLKDRAIGHLTGAIAQFPRSVLLRERLAAIYLNEENLAAGIRVMLESARILAPVHREHALRILREIQFLDEDNAAAKELIAALEGGTETPEEEAADVGPERAAADAARASGLPEDLDVDVDVVEEPVRTIVVPPPEPARLPPAEPAPASAAAVGPERVSGPPPVSAGERVSGPPPVSAGERVSGPPPVSAGERVSGPPPVSAGERVSGPPPVSAAPLPAPFDLEPPPGQPAAVVPPPAGGPPEKAMVVDLPSFDEVETGPPFLQAAGFLAGSDRLVVPLSEQAAAPLVLEMSDEEFVDDLAKAAPLVDEFEAAGPAPLTLEMDEPDEAELATTNELPAPPAPATPSAALDAAITQGLEEVEFFRQQGLEDDARTLLEGLAAEYPQDARIAAKLAELRGGPAAAETAPSPAEPARSAEPSDGLEALESALDALASGASGAHPLPGQAPEAVGELAPSDATMHFDLGVAYREMGVLDRAIDEFRLAAKDPSREASCQALIGACLLGMGKTREAIEEYKRGLHARRRTEADELELYYGLAEVHMSLGEGNEALFYLQTIKRRDPGFRDVARKLAALQTATRPGRRPGVRSEPPPAQTAEDDGKIDEAFDDFFKDGRS